MTGLFSNIMFQDLLAQYPGVRLEVEQYLSKWSRNLTIDYGKTMEKYILLDKVYFLVNFKSCHARVLNWAIRENVRPVELAQYGIFLYWASSTGRILSRIAKLRTLLWQL